MSRNGENRLIVIKSTTTRVNTVHIFGFIYDDYIRFISARLSFIYGVSLLNHIIFPLYFFYSFSCYKPSIRQSAVVNDIPWSVAHVGLR